MVRQFSVVSPAPRCGHGRPGTVASSVLLHGMAGCGARNRSAPSGGRAYGILWNTTRSPLATPRTAPSAVWTTGDARASRCSTAARVSSRSAAHDNNGKVAMSDMRFIATVRSNRCASQSVNELPQHVAGGSRRALLSAVRQRLAQLVELAIARSIEDPVHGGHVELRAVEEVPGGLGDAEPRHQLLAGDLVEPRRR